MRHQANSCVLTEPLLSAKASIVDAVFLRQGLQGLASSCSNPNHRDHRIIISHSDASTRNHNPHHSTLAGLCHQAPFYWCFGLTFLLSLVFGHLLFGNRLFGNHLLFTNLLLCGHLFFSHLLFWFWPRFDSFALRGLSRPLHRGTENSEPKQLSKHAKTIQYHPKTAIQRSTKLCDFQDSQQKNTLTVVTLK